VVTARRVAGQGAGWEHAGVDLEENKALVRRYYQEVLTGRDRDLLARLLRIPIDSDHSFRSNPIADSGVSDHLAGVGVS